MFFLCEHPAGPLPLVGMRRCRAFHCVEERWTWRSGTKSSERCLSLMGFCLLPFWSLVVFGLLVFLKVFNGFFVDFSDFLACFVSVSCLMVFCFFDGESSCQLMRLEFF